MSHTRDEIGPREAEFLKHYLAGDEKTRFNGTQSMLACGLTTEPKVAAILAIRELAKPCVEKAVQEFVRHDVTSVQKVLTRTARLAYADIDEVMSWETDGTVTIKSSAEMSRTGKALLAGLTQVTTTVEDRRAGTVTTTRRVEVKLRDIDGARRDLMKFHGLLKRELTLMNPDGSPLSMTHKVQIELPSNGREPTVIDAKPIRMLKSGRNGKAKNGHPTQ